MKNHRTLKYCGLAVGALLLAGASQSFAQTSDFTFDTFDTGISGVGNWYGSGVYTFDSTVDNSGNGGGSLYITVPDDATGDTPLNPYICLGGANPWYLGGSPSHVDLTLYKSIDFDIKWDTNSALTIDQFNDCSTWPTNFGLPAGQFNGDPYSRAFNIKATDGAGNFIQLGSTNIPTSASNGWAHISFPIDHTIAGISTVNGIDLEKWIAHHLNIVGAATVHFWIDNIVLKGTAGPPPPPTVKIPTKATPGLNVFASTSGLYDRQSAVLRQSTGLSWVGVATPANPVSYSFTIAGYPNSPDCEAYLFLIPNPAYLDGAPDWNETNCVVIYLQGTSNNATMHFRYKVNEPNQQAMYSGGNETRGYYTNAPGSWDGVTTNYLESGNLGFVTNNGVLGTWTVKFTSDTNLTLIAPNGNSASLVFPNYNVGYFAEQAVPGFYAYLGMQANNANAMNQAVVYANFAVSNSVMPFSENFLADSVLDITNVWNTGPASGPKGIFIAPAGSSGWVSWSLPDPGFGLEAATTLSDPLAWTSPSTGPILAMNGIRAQLVSSNEWPAGNTAFFRLVKRTFTQLQVLLPGQTNAPNTTLGYVGSPTPISLAAQGSTPTTVTVNAVDGTYHVINGVIDSIHLTTTDGSAFMPADMQMVNGTASFTGSSGVLFQTSGSQTVTATDTTNTNIPAATSAAVTIAP